MFGVLVAEAPDGSIGFLRAFSGTIEGGFDLPGYVPPIFLHEARAAVEVPGEKLVKNVTARAAKFAASPEVVHARGRAAALALRQRDELRALRERHAENRKVRRARRREIAQSATDAELGVLDQQSRRDKAERRQLEAAHAGERAVSDRELLRVERRLAAHARLRRMVSRHVMRQIHDTYRVANARGECRPLRELYAPSEPPGGAGDCAAPKLLAYAFAHGLRPLALAEFWWGAPPPTGGRISGAFYPACREKCGPLLPFMLEGLEVAAPRRFEPPKANALELRIVYEDDRILVIDKPAGLLSVPGRAGREDSVLARVREREPQVQLVHRLDLDTSGLLVAARDADAYAALQRQFLRRTVQKRYVAMVEGHPLSDRGVIELAMRVDIHDRPRQIVDPVHGRKAVTEWHVLEAGEKRTRVALFPRTGRTHQLRVHAAHPLGLAAPIVGDRLYGYEGERLMLHAEALSFLHPATGERVSFESRAPF